ncbi:MAG: hypothetical protein MJ179_02590 [Treponema sp.]|nr:hypothetical protein [Treponema sp.]
MKKSVFNLVVGIMTGVEAIAEAVCGFAIKDPFIKGATLSSIPVIANGVIVVCSNFVKPDEEKEEKDEK